PPGRRELGHLAPAVAHGSALDHDAGDDRLGGGPDLLPGPAELVPGMERRVRGRQAAAGAEALPDPLGRDGAQYVEPGAPRLRGAGDPLGRGVEAALRGAVLGEASSLLDRGPSHSDPIPSRAGRARCNTNRSPD